MVLWHMYWSEMNIQNVIGELLYIGIVAEKGRCYGVRWKFGYKKLYGDILLR